MDTLIVSGGKITEISIIHEFPLNRCCKEVSIPLPAKIIKKWLHNPYTEYKSRFRISMLNYYVGDIVSYKGEELFEVIFRNRKWGLSPIGDMHEELGGSIYWL